MAWRVAAWLNERRRSRIEIGAFALVAIVPLIPYLVVLLHGVPRYTSIADFAIIEQYARHVFTGETLVGLNSRYSWHHPGPLFFYFVAPFTFAFGKSSTGLFLGSWVLVALAVGTLSAMTRRFSTRACALGVLAGLIAWLAAFGDVATNPWGRLIGVAPLMVSIGFAALVARGVKIAIYPLMFFGCIAAETHVSMFTSVAVIGAGALASLLVRAARRRTVAQDAKHIALGLLLLLVFVTPMLIEQGRAAAGHGNITRLYDFFIRHRQPLKSYETAIRDWAMATAWLPDRILERRVAHETGLPMMMRWDAVPQTLTQTARTFTVIHLVTAIGASVVALRRRDTASLAFLACGVAGEVIAMSSLRAIVGEDHYSLIFWVTAPCAVTWMGVFSSFASSSAPYIAELRARWARSALVVIAVLAIMKVTDDQRVWTMRHWYAPATMPWLAKDLRPLVTTVEQYLATNAEVPVIHLGTAWPLAAAVALELEKDGFDVRYAQADVPIFAGARSDAGLAHPLHVWFRSPGAPLPIAACVDKIDRENTYEVFGSTSDVRVCNRL